MTRATSRAGLTMMREPPPPRAAYDGDDEGAGAVRARFARRETALIREKGNLIPESRGASDAAVDAAFDAFEDVDESAANSGGATALRDPNSWSEKRADDLFDEVVLAWSKIRTAANSPAGAAARESSVSGKRCAMKAEYVGPLMNAGSNSASTRPFTRRARASKHFESSEASLSARTSLARSLAVSKSLCGTSIAATFAMGPHGCTNSFQTTSKCLATASKSDRLSFSLLNLMTSTRKRRFSASWIRTRKCKKWSTKGASLKKDAQAPRLAKARSKARRRSVLSKEKPPAAVRARTSSHVKTKVFAVSEQTMYVALGHELRKTRASPTKNGAETTATSTSGPWTFLFWSCAKNAPPVARPSSDRVSDSSSMVSYEERLSSGSSLVVAHAAAG
mmetsp:Transcript_24715/g.83070  ORF Transcript_24715/g.83070 Transcript_24715/m.83070 type:complete len:393 (+) Transcript_24715:2314-3492(+)